jgi:copper resistance protein B
MASVSALSHGQALPSATPAPEADRNASAAQHIPPQPPEHLMPEMPYPEMAHMMQMDDTARTGTLLLDQFEWRDTAAGSAGFWEAEAWYGGDYNKLWLRTEGERVHGTTEDARVELFWDRIFARWWSLQAGVREDFANGPSRTWAALGVQGLAPYWFEVEATAYVGDAGRTAARVKVEYELLLTQRFILQPEAEVNLYGKADPERQLGSGLSDLDVGLRLRYEIRRQFAPYVGVAWTKLFGETAAAAQAEGRSTSDVQALAGIRIWF